MPLLSVLTNEGDPAPPQNRAARNCAYKESIYRNAKIHIMRVEFNPR